MDHDAGKFHSFQIGKNKICLNAAFAFLMFVIYGLYRFKSLIHLKHSIMTKQIIAVLVSAVILFLWQFLSWSMLGVHQSEFKYTANQDKILEALNENLAEEGTYMLPGVPPGSSMEQEQALMEAHAGKPWVSVTYHKSMSTAMGMKLIRAFLADVVAAFLLIWVLMKFENRNLGTVLLSSIAVGLVGYITIPYLNSIWFETNSMGYLIDAVVQWGVVGLWLGWWLPRS
jgi:hypothetical protein